MGYLRGNISVNPAANGNSIEILSSEWEFILKLAQASDLPMALPDALAANTGRCDPISSGIKATSQQCIHLQNYPILNEFNQHR